jgi:hypothetical protein
MYLQDVTGSSCGNDVRVCAYKVRPTANLYTHTHTCTLEIVADVAVHQESYSSSSSSSSSSKRVLGYMVINCFLPCIIRTSSSVFTGEVA